MNKILIGGSIFSTLLLSLIFNQGSSQRTPANNEMPFELTLTSVAIDPIGKLKDMESAYIRATFNETDVVEFYNKNRKPLKITEAQYQALRKVVNKKNS